MIESIQKATDGLASEKVSFFKGYITALLWSSVREPDENGTPDINDDHDADDMHPDTLKHQLNDCLEFIAATESLLAERSEFTGWDSMGHDFALTRNGHGTGFWDRGLVHDDKLTEHCKPFGEMFVYLGDDEKIHHI